MVVVAGDKLSVTLGELAATAVNVTVPVKPPNGTMLNVDVPDAPVLTVSVGVHGVIAKSEEPDATKSAEVADLDPANVVSPL